MAYDEMVFTDLFEENVVRKAVEKMKKKSSTWTTKNVHSSKGKKPSPQRSTEQVPKRLFPF